MKKETNTDIIETLNATIAGLSSEIETFEANEKNDQKEWEKLVKESLEKHTSDMKFISDRQGAKATLETSLVTEVKEKEEKMQELKASTKYLSELKGNSTGFLRPSVCARKPTSPKDIDSALLKKLVVWT